MDFNKEYNIKKTAVEKKIHSIFENESFHSELLGEIMEYAVLNGGKRIRPVLFLSAYELKDKNWENALDFACALEFIHSYSLVHDDLPAMDNDELRRGKPTCHVKYSYYGAILAGDALLNFAFETMLNAANEKKFENALYTMKIIADASGNKGMCAGQMADMHKDTESFDKLCKMYEDKTGALLKASILGGFALGNGNVSEMNILSEFSYLLGLIFQIKDDMLDVTSTIQILGKPVFSDEKNEKLTFVSQYGLEKCHEIIDDYVNKALKLLEKLNYDTSFLKELTLYIAKRNN